MCVCKVPPLISGGVGGGVEEFGQSDMYNVNPYIPRSIAVVQEDTYVVGVEDIEDSVT